MGLRYEAWTLPWDSSGFKRKVAKLPVPEGAGSGSRVFLSTAEDGQIELNADQFARLSEVISDIEGSLIRVYDSDTLVHEWMAERVSRATDDQNRNVTISGPGIKAAFDKAFIYPFDYPTSPTENPNWVWAGSDALTDGEMEDAKEVPEIYEIDFDGGTGTFTLTVGGATTNAINHNAGAGTVESELEALNGTPPVEEVQVSERSDGFRIEFVNPAILDVNMTANFSGITGGGPDLGLTVTQEGSDNLPAHWTKSQYLDRFSNPAEHGTYASDGFRLTESPDPVRNGTHSLRINGLSQFAGCQQVVSVEPGQRYQATVHVWSSDTTEEFRLVIRDRYETLIGWVNFANTTGSQWEPITLDFITELPDGTPVDTIIFRFAQITDQNPIPYYVDDASLKFGAPSANPGEIITPLLDDATSDHVADPRGITLDWVDYSSFDTSNDSSTTPWTASHSFEASFGETYGQVLDKLVDLEYEWDLLPKATPAGGLTHDLVIYNSGGLDNAPSTAITIRQGVTGGDVINRIPAYTAVVVEGADGQYFEAEDATAVGNFGRMEAFFAARHLADTTSLSQHADQLLAAEAANRTAVRFEIADTGFHPKPLVTYTVGDTVPMQMPPLLSKENRRVQRIDYTNTFPTRWVVTGSRVLPGEAAAFDLVRRLWRKFSRPERTLRSGVSALQEANESTIDTVIPTIFIASTNSSTKSQAIADFVCDGTDDAGVFASAIAALPASGGQIVVAEGSYSINSTVGFDRVVQLQGLDALLTFNSTSAFNFNVAGDFSFVGFEVTRSGGSANPILSENAGGAAPNLYVSNCYFHDIDCGGIIRGTGAAGGHIRIRVVGNQFTNINLRAVGGGFTDTALFLVGENPGRRTDALIVANRISGVTKTATAGFSAFVFAENTDSEQVAIGNWVDGISGIDGFVNGGIHAAHNYVSGSPQAGSHTGVDHGTLGGLGDDDHGQYLKEKGSGGLASEIPVHTHLSAAEAGTFDYIDIDGITGALEASRYVGATTSGAPASGTFAIGDFVIAQDGNIYVCTVAGSPGTWVAVGATAATDNDAIHDNVSGEIAAVTEKTSPVSADLVLIEDSEASNAKKRVQVGNLPGGTGGGAGVASLVGCEVSQTTTNQSIAHNTTEFIAWETEVLDQGDCFDSANNTRFTAPTDGWYVVSFLVDFATGEFADNDVIYLGIHVSGSQVSYPTKSVGTNDIDRRAMHTQVVYLNANDYVECRVQQNSGTAALLDVAKGWFAQIADTGHTAAPGLEVRLTANQLQTTATWESISWDAEEYDDDDYWEGVTNPTRITFPDKARYLVTASVIHDGNATGERYVRAIRNGNVANELFIVSNNAPRTGGPIQSRTVLTGIVDAAAGDYIEIQAYQNSGGNLNISGTGTVGDDAETTRAFVTRLSSSGGSGRVLGNTIDGDLYVTGTIFEGQDGGTDLYAIGGGTAAKLYATEPGLRPPDSPGIGDLEFLDYANGTSPTGTPGLSWLNQGTATAQIDNGRLIMVGPTASGIRALLKATPGAGNFKIATRAEAGHWQTSPAYQLVFLWGTIATPTQIESCGFYNAGTPRLNWTTYNTSTFAATSDRVATTTNWGWPQRAYFRVDWDGTDLVYQISPSGHLNTWLTVYTATLGAGRPDFVGVGINSNGAGLGLIADFPFIRFDWIGSDFDPTT